MVKGFDRLTTIRRKAEQIDFSAPRLQPEQILKDACNRTAKSVREILVGNLRNSGIQEITGELRRAVNQSRVWYEKGRIRFAFGTGQSNKLYTRANSLNYGWVNQPKMTRVVMDLPTMKGRIDTAPILGSKATKTLKKQMLKKMGQSHRVDVWRNGQPRTTRPHGVTLNSRNLTTNKSGNPTLQVKGEFDGKTTSGQVTVIPPKPYYYLSEVQAQLVLQIFRAHVEAIVARQMTKDHGKSISA